MRGNVLTGVDAAVAMAQLGYHVHPCRLVRNERGIKVPSGLPGQWQSAGLLDDGAVRRAWSSLQANAYMVATGPSGVTGVDLDVKPGVDGRVSWQRANGPTGAFVVATPSGGLHHYFASTGAGNREGVLPGVDIRGIGGGLFGPGSTLLDHHGQVVGEYRPVFGSPVRGYLHVEPPGFAEFRRVGPSSALDPFFAPAMPAGQAAAKARAVVADLASMPNVPGSGMRRRINDAALFLGGLVHTGWFTVAEASRALMDACAVVFGTADGDDQRWIETAVRDGLDKPVNVVADLPPVPEKPRDTVSNANQVIPGLESPRRLPMIPDRVWNAYGWSTSIRSAARRADVCPDAVLGAMLATYAARLPPSLRIHTGTKMPITGQLVIALVGPSGSDKSTAFRLAQQISPGSSVPVISNPNSGEAFAASFVHPDPDGEGSPGRRAKVLKPDPRALFYVSEGGMVAGVSSRMGSTWLPHLRALAMGEALSTTNATADINRQVPDGSYSAGVVVGFQATTAMTVLTDTSTGTSQRFLWFTALGSAEVDFADANGYWPMTVPTITRLAESVDELNNPLHTLAVVASVTARIKAEQRHQRLTRDLAATDDHDAHRHALVAKLAAVAVLADDRVLIEERDWSWAEDLYAASAAVRGELLELADDREQQERAVVAVRYAQGDQVRKQYSAEVVRVADVLVRAVQRHGPMARRRLRDATASRDRAYFSDALKYAAAQGHHLTEGHGQ